MEGTKDRLTHDSREILVLKVELMEVCVACGGHAWTVKY